MVLVPRCHYELMHQIQQTWMVALGSAYEAFGVPCPDFWCADDRLGWKSLSLVGIKTSFMGPRRSP